MIQITKILGNAAQATTPKATISVPFEWFECDRKRLYRVAADGTCFGLAVSGGIKEGDILYETEKARYVVSLAECSLLSVEIRTMEEAARVGFELGNRHLSLKIFPDHILIPYDRPTHEYLLKKDFNVSMITGRFDNFIVCHAHEH